MLLRERLENKLREKGYSYSSENKTTRTWRKGQHRVYIKKCNYVREKFARLTLRQCGVDEDEIESFLRSALS